MSPAMLVSRPVGLAEIDVIATIPNQVLRNLWITTAYHDLALSLRAVLGANVSWCAFATWASKTAGASIRGEILSQLRDELRASPAFQALAAPAASSHLLSGVGVHLWPLSRFEDRMLGLFDGPIRRLSAHIAEGNLNVFCELGPPFAALAALLGGAAPPTADQIDSFLSGVRAIDGDAEATTRLRAGFGHYCAVPSLADPAAVAEHTLLASGLIGLSEQIRLQPVIRAALDTPFEDPGAAGAGSNLEAEVGSLLTGWAGAIPDGRSLLSDLDRRRGELLRELQAIWRRVLTRLFLTIRMPDGPLGLSRDVPSPDGGARWPADLARLRLAALIAFLDAQDRTGGTGMGSGAQDWADLDQRMNYIVNLFRSWQQHARLLTPPFSDAQIAVMQSGGVPDGPL